ncbi:hypothetical protein NDU88_007134 [Pleurodeles waltl]|uniref:Uncharacterized protein n=1 Tax=Pleurodeles waltl TaxID=8319 RepID=A0AAV7QJT7_PLEWA|nr:hypothetical protein NDU88_007134 [Pleurodeles waltl]
MVCVQGRGKSVKLDVGVKQIFFCIKDAPLIETVIVRQPFVTGASFQSSATGRWKWLDQAPSAETERHGKACWLSQSPRVWLEAGSSGAECCGPGSETKGPQRALGGGGVRWPAGWEVPDSPQTASNARVREEWPAPAWEAQRTSGPGPAVPVLKDTWATRWRSGPAAWALENRHWGRPELDHVENREEAEII